MPAETDTATKTPTETPETPADTAAAEATAVLDDTPPETGGWMDALDKALEELPPEGDANKADEAKAEADKADADKTEADKTEADKAEPDADDEVVKSMTKSAGDAFKTIKAEKKVAVARAEAAEAELKLAKEAPEPNAEEVTKLTEALAERESKLAEAEKELAVSRFEATDEYKESVIVPMAGILSVVERLAKKYEVPEKRLMNLLEESDIDAQGEIVTEVASEFSERDRVSLYALADDYGEILAHREDLRSKSSEALAAREKLQVSKAEQAAESDKKGWEQATKKVWGALKEKLPLPEDVGERSKLEASVIEQVSGAQFDGQTPEVKAFAGYSAALIPHFVTEHKRLTTQLTEVKAALAKYQAAVPGAGAGDHKADTGQLPASASFLDAVNAGFTS
jgi:hypothetical protein